MNVLVDVSARVSSFKIDCANCGPPVEKESQGPQFLHFRLLTNCLKNCSVFGNQLLIPSWSPSLGRLLIF